MLKPINNKFFLTFYELQPQICLYFRPKIKYVLNFFVMCTRKTVSKQWSPFAIPHMSTEIVNVEIVIVLSDQDFYKRSLISPKHFLPLINIFVIATNQFNNWYQKSELLGIFFHPGYGLIRMNLLKVNEPLTFRNDCVSDDAFHKFLPCKP